MEAKVLETHPINHPINELSLRVFGLSLLKPLKPARSHLALAPSPTLSTAARLPVCPALLNLLPPSPGQKPERPLCPSGQHPNSPALGQPCPSFQAC